MKTGRYVFPPFAVDTQTGSCCRDSVEIRLRAKTFAVLCYLLERAGQLVSKDELLAQVWTGTAVAEGALTVCITELRKALGDDPKSPRFIATVPKRGYRFIAPITTVDAPATSSPPLATSHSAPESTGIPQPGPGNATLEPVLVGRDAELAHLYQWFARAGNGQRQCILVTGEPGIGKTTLVEAFLRGIERRQAGPSSRLWMARGQCIEHFGSGEAYLPILDALGQLCRLPGGERLLDILDRYAPTWLVQMPELLNAIDLEAVQRRVVGATRERMLREMTGALEVLTTDSTLILVLEDLHWSDFSTLDLLSFVARRPLPARLLLIGTYRPGDVLRHAHPLLTVTQELQLHGQCEELALTSLKQEDVGEYLARQFPGSALPTRLGAVVYHRTEGNPLFMVNMVHEFVRQGIIAQQEGHWEVIGEPEKSSVPVGLRQFIEQQLGRLRTAERIVLETASVVGLEFSVAAVAAALGKTVPEVEACCAELARRQQFLQASGVSTWPDGTIAARYRFRHALYQNVFYEQVSAGRRVGLHQQIGERLEAAYSDRAREVASELAVHFERGQNVPQAVQYLGQAGENALRQNAHVEAISLLNHALALLQTLPDSPPRAQQELALYLLLRTPLAATKGYVAPEVERVYARTYELCKRVGKPAQLFMVLGGPYALHFLRSELPAAYRLAQERMQLAETLRFDLFLQVAHICLGQPLLFMGELPRARQHLEQSWTLYKPQPLGALGYLYDPGIMALSLLAFVLWLLGYPDQARQRSQDMLALARQLSHPYSLAYALIWAARIYWQCGEAQTAQQLENELMTLCTDNGFTHLLAMGTISQGCGLIEQGQSAAGLARFSQGFAAYRATGEKLGSSSYLIILAEAYGKTGQWVEAGNTFAEAQEFIHQTEERFWEAELYRLRGEFVLQSGVRGAGPFSRRPRQSHVGTLQHPDAPSQAEAEACFLQAIGMAQKQQAKSLELRAVMRLTQLWQLQGKHHAARQRLAEIYHWFTEGFDTRDIQEAKTLLQGLSQHQDLETAPAAMSAIPTPHLRLVVNKDGGALPPPQMPRIEPRRR